MAIKAVFQRLSIRAIHAKAIVCKLWSMLNEIQDFVATEGL